MRDRICNRKDYATLMGAPGYHCYAMCEIIYNNENKFGVVYHYVFYLERKEKEKQLLFMIQIVEKF